ncbi:MAG: hypothetical protein IH944_00260 [Armatimonadetes bacterium]|nr:hypothetical protein [Armatimonadota bacterium]
MDAVKNPISILFAAIAVIGAVWYMPLLFAGAVGWLATVAYLSFKQSSRRRHESDLTAAGRQLIKPLVAARAELDKAVRSGLLRPEFASISQEALREADAIIEQASRRVDAYDGFSRTIKDRKSAEFKLAQLEEKLASQMSDEERQSLLSAISSWRGVLERYEEIQAGMAKIESTVNSAADAMIDVKDRLLNTGQSSGVEDLDDDDLPGMVDRLKTLTATIEEADEMIGDRLR